MSLWCPCVLVSARVPREVSGDPPQVSFAQKFHCQDKVQGRMPRGTTEKEQRLGGLENSAGTQRNGKEGMLFTSSDPIFLHEQQQNAAWHRFASSGRVKSRARS